MPTRFPAVDTTPGWVGCRESHLQVLEMFKDCDGFAIYEDDVKFLTSLDYIYIAMGQLPDDWDMLYLGASPKEPQERYSDNLFKVKNAHVTHAIIWHPRVGGAIDYILEHRQEIRKIDDFFATTIQPKFNCFLTYPLICTQIQTKSDTCGRSDVSTIMNNYNRYCI